jgi:hypothetical protein
VLIGDIEKAFLNVEVDREDRDYLRFLWVKDVVSGNLETVVYRFCRVVFGVNASPFLLNATLKHHIEKFAETDPIFVQKMKDGFYVDDLVSGGRATDEVKDLYGKAKTRMATGGFKLRKWLTNDAALRKHINENEGAAITQKVTRLDEFQTYAQASLGIPLDNSCDKVLGLKWDCENDLIKFDLLKLVESLKGTKLTKRNLLSTLAKMFDPLGLVSCVIVIMKILFQQLCVDNLNWDEELVGKHAKAYLDWIEDLKRVETITLDRCVYSDVSGEIQSCELHGFGDASEKAYCAVVYFVCRTSTGVYVKLLTAKTRVAPLKALTIPRLELMSALMLAKLVDSVKKALASQIENLETRYWLDSITALYWIQNNGEWKQFVRHRVNQILALTKKGDWNHCPGVENPADLGSRGILASKLLENPLWWAGPKWLSSLDKAWPKSKIDATEESKGEEKKTTVLVTKVQEIVGIDKVVSVERYSSVERLFRVTAWVKRFVQKLISRIRGVQDIAKTSGLEREELLSAERLWIEASQKQLRKEENFKQLESQLKLVEEDRILRCRGRFAESDLVVDAKYPILLPKESKFTELIILRCHDKVHHSGVRATLAEVRSRFWIPKGRQRVKAILSKCTVCRKLEGKPYNVPKEADLPGFRVRQTEPFEKTGVDFAGPLYVKNAANGTDKVYIALFSCCVSRALHLDLVKDLSTEEFLRCLRRFSARRGTPALIVSDNAKTFKASARALKKLYSCENVQGYLGANRIEWKFNLERAPWWGGFFERMVQSVKRCLRKVLGSARLTYEELLTTLVEVEGTLNSRPLTYGYDEVGSEPLTPSHLMVGRRLVSMPDGVVSDESDEKYCSKQFQYLSKKKQHFWNRWRREYLADLRESHRKKDDGSRRVAEKGDVVIVYEDNVKRGSWKTGVVEELVEGRDGTVRGAKVRLVRNGKTIFLSRPVQKLFPTEVKHDEGMKKERKKSEKSEANKENEKREVSESRTMRPKRAAALDSEWKTRSMVD